MIGEDVWDDPSRAELIKLEPAAAQLEPLIKPLPPFDEATMGVRRR
jgi:hypothetical protein